MGNNWAICVGVSEYRFHQNLKYAHRDAEELGKLLKEKAKFERIYTFTKDSPPIDDGRSEFPSSPERSNFIEWLTQRFPTNTKRKPLSLSDNLWFSFSGHGWEYEGKHYLLFSDTSSNEDFLTTTAISVELIREHLRQYSGAGNIIMFIDACREAGRRNINNYIDKQQGVITIASCEPNGFSYEIKELEHGSFTYALLESLQLLGEGNCATVERLCNRLRNRVKELNLKYQKPLQIPYTVIEPHSKYHLFLLPDYILPSLNDIACLEKEAFKAEAKGDYEMAKIMWQNLVKFNQDEALEALERIWEWERIGTRNINVSPVISVDATPKEKITTGIKSIKNVIQDVTPNDNPPQKEERKQSFTEDLGNGIELDMVYIPDGKFMMGSNESKYKQPIHQVQLQAFYMSKYPITQAQYQAIMGENPARFQGKKNPVEQVRWNDAQQFCQKLSTKTGKQYKLPSEAQWEYACRAGSEGKWYFGDDKSQLKDYAWYSENSHQQTHPVGQKKPNQWGLYDMHGNVWEWCEDDWHSNYDNAPDDGNPWIDESNKSNTLVVRGGSWLDPPNYCRSAYRDNINRRDDYLDDIGFRLVCGLGRDS